MRYQLILVRLSHKDFLYLPLYIIWHIRILNYLVYFAPVNTKSYFTYLVKPLNIYLTYHYSYPTTTPHTTDIKAVFAKTNMTLRVPINHLFNLGWCYRRLFFYF